MDFILIGIGAGIGSVFRYEIGRRISQKNDRLKIFGTFTVNIIGAFLLGIVVNLSLDNLWWGLLADGFLGGFTTFSTLMVEGVQLIRGSKKTNAIVYFALTMFLGIMVFAFGSAMVNGFSAR